MITYYRIVNKNKTTLVKQELFTGAPEFSHVLLVKFVLRYL